MIENRRGRDGMETERSHWTTGAPSRPTRSSSAPRGGRISFSTAWWRSVRHATDRRMPPTCGAACSSLRSAVGASPSRSPGGADKWALRGSPPAVDGVLRDLPAPPRVSEGRRYALSPVLEEVRERPLEGNLGLPPERLVNLRRVPFQHHHVRRTQPLRVDASQSARVLHVPTITRRSALSDCRRSWPPTQPGRFFAAGVTCRSRLYFTSGAGPPAPSWLRKVTTTDRASAFPSGPLISTTTKSPRRTSDRLISVSLNGWLRSSARSSRSDSTTRPSGASSTRSGDAAAAAPLSSRTSVLALALTDSTMPEERVVTTRTDGEPDGGAGGPIGEPVSAFEAGASERASSSCRADPDILELTARRGRSAGW